MEINFLQISEQIYPETLNHRRYLHQNPELSFNEIYTTKYISSILKSLDIEHKFALKSSPEKSDNNIGVVAWLGKGEQSIALRADIDALPISEETNFSFSSTKPGIMHACGHDIHTAMLLSVAKILKQYEAFLPNKVIMIFQPGEEQLPGGAKLILDSQILDEFNIKAFYGQHINPEIPVGKIATKPGPLMASTDEFHIKIIGKSTHAAQPHLGADPIFAANNLINFLYSLPTKYANPLEPVLIAITAFNSGNATNIVPDEAKLMGTMRTYNQDLRNKLKSLITEHSKNIVQSYGCKLQFDIVEGYPPLLNNDKCVDIVINSIFSHLGKDYFTQAEPKMWAEDFAYYSQFAPSCFWFLGCGSQSMDFYPLHNPKLNPIEESMIFGTALMASLAFTDI